MATAKDVKDMLGMSGGDIATKPAAAKKPKVPGGKRLTGINREVLALHGDRAPPVALVDPVKTFRGKLKRDLGKPVSKWEPQAFTNSARLDGLQLRHWRKQKPAKPANGDAMDTDEPVTAPDYDFAKYNIEITVPTYTDEQYEKHLQSKDWSKQETDYLLRTVKDWHQKWAVIWDRYEYTPSSSSSVKSEDDSTALVKAQEPKERTVEQLKARYYEIWSKTMALESGGPQNMNEAEFALHETLTKYNPKNEANRKDLAWALNNRTAEEIREEEYLLSELQRIMISAGKYEAERAEVRQRLESAPTVGGAAGSGLASSNFAALNQLYNSLAAQDRSRKARHRLSMGSSDILQSPAGIGQNGTPITAGSHRESLGSAGGPNRKAAMVAQQPVRTLPPRQEKRFGVTTHDRLNGGISFRSDKLIKARQAKSQIQTQKIASALTELGVPDLIQLPTQRVSEAFEALVAKVTRLVETRKALEKEEAEFRVQGAMRDELKQPEGTGTESVKEEGETTVNGTEDGNDQDVDGDGEADDKDADGEDEDDAEGDYEDDVAGEDDDEDVDEDAEGEEDDEDADGEEADDNKMKVDDTPQPRPSSSRSVASRSHKRSASVMSAVSSASKRSRKGK